MASLRACLRQVAIATRPLGSHVIARRLTARIPRVLMYHRFAAGPIAGHVEADLFERHIAFLRARFRLRTMGQLAEELRTHGQVAANTAVITVDDGYRDFAEIALPILIRHEAVATVYVTTGFTDGTHWLWPDKVAYALQHAGSATVSVAGLGVLSRETPGARQSAWQSIIDRATALPEAERLKLIDDVLDASGVRLPAKIPAELAPMTWDDVRAASSAGVEIGAHTVSHPILSRVDERQLRHEIVASKQRIEQEIGSPVRSFCYPNGQRADVSARAASMVSEAGYTNAVVAYFDRQVLDDLYAIRRMGADENEAEFSYKSSGFEWLAMRRHANGGDRGRS